MRFDFRPELFLCRIGKEILQYGSAFRRFGKWKQRFARDPAIGNSLFPTRRTLALSHDDPNAIVAQIERLSRTLYAVPEDCNGFICQYCLSFPQREFTAGDDIFQCAAEIDAGHKK